MCFLAYSSSSWAWDMQLTSCQHFVTWPMGKPSRRITDITIRHLTIFPQLLSWLWEQKMTERSKAYWIYSSPTQGEYRWRTKRCKSNFLAGEGKTVASTEYPGRKPDCGFSCTGLPNGMGSRDPREMLSGPSLITGSDVQLEPWVTLNRD